MDGTGTTEQLKVSQYMTPSPICIDPTMTLEQALEVMRDNGIRHLPVVDNGKLVGLLSERDAHLPRSLEGMWANRISVEEMMTRDPFRVTKDEPVEVVALQMWKKKWGSAVVMENKRVVGVFTTTDALRALVELLALGRGAAPLDGVTGQADQPTKS